MHTPPNPFDLQTIAACWQAFDSVAHVHPIRSLDDYERMVALMDSLLAATGDDEDHPLSSLLDLVGDVVEKYEREHYAIKAASPQGRAAFSDGRAWTKARGLGPTDPPKQSVGDSGWQKENQRHAGGQTGKILRNQRCGVCFCVTGGHCWEL